MAKCYFCSKEYFDTRDHQNYLRLPMLFRCKEHYPEVIFTDESEYSFEYRDTLVVCIEVNTNRLEIVEFRADQAEIKSSPNDIVWRTVVSSDLPETRDLQEFIQFVDRLLVLQNFS